MPIAGRIAPDPDAAFDLLVRIASAAHGLALFLQEGIFEFERDRQASKTAIGIHVNPCVGQPLVGRGSDELVAEDGQELKSVVAFAAGFGGEDGEDPESGRSSEGTKHG
jgi:hypothetical protein